MKGKSLLHLIKFTLGLDQTYTQTTLSEREALEKYASGASSAIEIGVFEGVITAILSRALGKEGKIFGIDPFFKGKLGICYHKAVAKLHIKRKGVRKKVHLVEKLSFDAAEDVPGEVDFIFIDGDHSWEGISRDWPLFSARLRPGGIMALHDTSIIPADGGTVQDSVRYYNEVIRHDHRFEWLETVDRMNVLKRK